jgi:hypothetical protein
VTGSARDVDRAGQPLGQPGEEPGSEVTGVDVLQRPTGTSRSDHAPAARDAVEPPRKPADVLVRAEDQSGAAEQRIWEDVQHGKLGTALERGVVAVQRPRVAVDQRRTLVDVAASGVDGHTRHVAVALHPAVEQPG